MASLGDLEIQSGSHKGRLEGVRTRGCVVGMLAGRMFAVRDLEFGQGGGRLSGAGTGGCQAS